MGRFETTAATYAARREPYPPAFFAAVAEALNLAGHEALIDLGTGPGLLALGFAPYVGRLLGVDPEPAMVIEARRAAAAARITFPVIDGRAENVSAELGPFDLVTIGRALHWMDREATLATFNRILAAEGRIVICGSTTVAADINPWLPAYEAVVRSWGERRDRRHRRLYQHWFDGTRFVPVAEIRTTHRQETTPEALFERALTRSTTSAAVLGPGIDPFRVELLEALRPFFPGNRGQEVVEARAWVFAAGSRI